MVDFDLRGDTRAVTAPAASCSYRELAASIAAWRARLGSAGIERGAVVGLEGDFSPNTIALFFALADHGAIVVPERTARVGGEARAELAQTELHFRVDSRDQVDCAPTGRRAAHELYDELRRRDVPGLVQFSSGTTGEPKAAVHDMTRLLEKFELPRPALTTLAFLMFDHLGGINTMLHALANGATLVAPGQDHSPENVCRLVEKHRVELLPATPTFFNLLLLSEANRGHDLSSLRVISYGAEPMAAPTLARLRHAFPGVRLQQTYGMIELGAMRTRSRDDGSLWVQVGGEGYRTRVVDGMLQVRARSLLLGYLNAPLPLTDDGWFETGDMVERDGDFFRFLGRRSDLINVGGEKVHPAEVEAVIESLDGVVQATVYGERNDLVGEIVCARVVASTDRADDLGRRVRRACRERLDRFKVPVRIEVVEEHTSDRVKKSRRGGATARTAR